MPSIYLQYHNSEAQGNLPQPIEGARWQIHTRVSSATRAQGKVALVVGKGKPRQYFLWSVFTIERTEKLPDGRIILEGPGTALNPPLKLSGAEFERFRARCANFIGFREITDLAYARKLVKLAEGSNENHNELEPEPAVALSIRQPHVEAILRGIKKIEYRREATSRRGRILIYSAKLFAENLAYWVKKYGFEKVDLGKLPRGVVAGSVELHACDGGEWHLRNPLRAKTLRRPTGRPQPIWFKPFE